MRKREACSKPFRLYWAWAYEHGGGFNTPAHAKATCDPVREAAKKTGKSPGTCNERSVLNTKAGTAQVVGPVPLTQGKGVPRCCQDLWVATPRLWLPPDPGPICARWWGVEMGVDLSSSLPCIYASSLEQKSSFIWENAVSVRIKTYSQKNHHRA